MKLVFLYAGLSSFLMLPVCSLESINGTETAISDGLESPCVTIPPGAFVFLDFLDFYSRNVNCKGDTFGVFYAIAIWTHIFLFPVLLGAWYVYKMEEYHYDYSQWRRGLIGISTRKMIIWFSGLLICAGDIVLFLFSPLSAVIYLGYVAHIVFLLWSALLFRELLTFRPHDIVRKGNKFVSDLNVGLVFVQLLNELRTTDQMIDFQIQVQADVGANRERFVGVAHIPGLSWADGRVQPKRVIANGLTEAAVTQELQAKIIAELGNFPPLIVVKSKILTSGRHDAGFTVTEQYHVPEEYETADTPVYIKG